jgi:hypothetical protein
MLAIRFVPKAGLAVLSANGRTYPVAGAATLDIPFPDASAIQSDQATRLMVTGDTSDRPSNDPGRISWPPSAMYDLTLGKVIFLVPGSNPAAWVDIAGAPA